MPEKRMEYDREFREGAVRIVEETGKPVAQVARDLGVHEGTLGNWKPRRGWSLAYRRSHVRNAASGSCGVVEAALWR